MFFQLPISIGTLPSSGSVNEEQRMRIMDGTVFKIYGNVGSTYEKANIIQYTEDESDKKFQFIFPKDTVVNADQTIFKTSSKIYTFTQPANTAIPADGTKLKNITRGTIKIEDKGSIEIPAASFLDNAGRATQKADSLKTTLESVKNHPLYMLGYVVYLWTLDMLRVLIFWVLLVSVYCWLIVPSKYLYPSDVSRYPYVFYSKGDDAYGYLKKTDTELCTMFTKSEVEDALKEQARWFKELDSMDKNPKEILEVLYPSILKHRSDGTNLFSSLVVNRCSTKDPCLMDYMIYFLVTLLFYNQLYCNVVLAGIHSVASSLKRSFQGLPKPVYTVLLASVLYILFSGVDAVNGSIVSNLGISLSPQNDLASLMKNQFLKFLLAILSVCLCLMLPVCSILVVTCIMATSYILFKTCISPYNGIVTLLAVLTLFFCISQYVYIISQLAKGMSPLDLLSNLFVSERKLETAYSFLGLTLPILFGLLYGIYIGFNLFLSFIQFMKRSDVQEILFASIWAFVIVGFVLFFLHIQKGLGHFYAMITASSIVLMGIVFYFQRLAASQLAKSKLAQQGNVTEAVPVANKNLVSNPLAARNVQPSNKN